MNAAFRDTAPADVVIVNSDTVVPAAWLERLRAAAYCDGLVATASTLTNHGTILSVPDRERTRRPSRRPGSRSRRGRRGGSRAPRRGCTRASRPASATASTSAARRSSWSATSTRRSRPATARRSTSASAASRAGCATSSPTTSTSSTAARARSAARARERQERQRGGAQPPLPVLREGGAGDGDVRDDPARALARRRPARGRRAVGDDRRLLPRADADRHAGARARADRRARAARRRAAARHRPALARRPRARRRSTSSASSGCGTTRPTRTPSRPTSSTGPYQVTTPRDLLLLGRLGRRVVLTQLDSIAYHNPAYFADHDEWRGYRELTRQALAFADRVVFCSPHAARRRAGRGPRRRRARRARAARHRPPRGRRRRASRSRRAGARGPPVPALPRHRLPAQEPPVRVRAVRARCATQHGFDGRLVLAGPHALRGTSARARRRRGARRTRSSPPTSSRSARRPRPRRRGCTATPRSCSTRRRSRASASSRSRPREAGAPSLWADAVLDGRPAAGRARRDRAVGRRRQRRQRRAADRDPSARARSSTRCARPARSCTWDRTRRAAARGLPRRRDRRRGASSAEPRESLTDLAMSLVGPGGWLTPDDQLALLAVSRPAAAASARCSAACAAATARCTACGGSERHTAASKRGFGVPRRHECQLDHRMGG